MRYRRAADTNFHTTFLEKFSVMPYLSYLILGMSLRIAACRYGLCHYGSQHATTDLTRTLPMLRMTLWTEKMIP